MDDLWGKGRSRLLGGGETTAFERWELPHVGDEKERAKVREEEAEAQVLTAEQIEAIQKEAYAEAYGAGYEKGLQEGREEGQREVRAAAQHLEKAFRALAQPLEDMDEEVEHQLTELALTIGRQLIRRELKTEPDQVVATVREALQALPVAAQNIRVFLHPEDAALVRENLAVPEGEERHWQIVEEPVLERGGCRVESDSSRIDATVEKRLNAIVAELMGGERKSDRDEPADAE